MATDWEARRRHVLSDPDPDGLESIRVLLDGAAIRVVRRLGGGVVSATHVVELEAAAGDVHQLVLKRFPPELDGVYATEEWECLSVARGCRVATPEPVALDAVGEWFGTPALLMSALDGVVTLRPPDRRTWLGELARALAMVHDHAVDGEVPDALQRPLRVSRWKPWSTPSPRARAVERSITDLAARAELLPRVLGHGDYHPGNVLFERDSVSGVVDWSGASLAPRAADVAQCRADLAICSGGAAPDLFLQAYEAEIGERVDGIAAWDVLRGDHALRFGPTWVDAFAEEGLTITVDEIVRAAELFIDDALKREH